MSKRTLINVAATVSLSMAAAACSSARGNEDRAGGRVGSGDVVTVAGCLSSAPDGRFALTAAPDAAVSTAARALGDERETNSYVLIGGQNLQSHVGKRVEVTGTLEGKRQELDHDAKSKSEAPRQGGKETPTVETNVEVELQVRQLRVSQVREVAPTCVLNP